MCKWQGSLDCKELHVREMEKLFNYEESASCKLCLEEKGVEERTGRQQECHQGGHSASSRPWLGD